MAIDMISALGVQEKSLDQLCCTLRWYQNNPQVLLQKPSVFKVVLSKGSNPFEINSSYDDDSFKKRAMDQFSNYTRQLAVNKVTVHLLDVIEQWYDSVYTTDTSHHCICLSSFARGNFKQETILVTSNMTKLNRKMEVTLKEDFFLKKNSGPLKKLKIINGSFEFGDTRFYHKISPVNNRKDFSFYQTFLLAGNCSNECLDNHLHIKKDFSVNRSSRISHRELAYYLKIPFLSLELRAPFYHLDTALMTLPCGKVVVYKPALTIKSFEELRRLVGEENLIFLSEKEAMSFVANGFVLNKTLFVPEVSLSFKSKMAGLGYRTEEVDINVYREGGGGLNCITDILNQMVFCGVELPKDLI